MPHHFDATLKDIVAPHPEDYVADRQPTIRRTPVCVSWFIC